MVKQLRFTILTILVISFNQLPAADKDLKKEFDVKTQKSALYEQCTEFTAPATAHYMTLNPDDSLLAVSCNDDNGAVYLYDAAGKKKPVTLNCGENSKPLNSTFSPDGTTLATQVRRDTHGLYVKIALLDLATRTFHKPLEQVDNNRLELSANFSSRNSTMLTAGCENGTVKVWCTSTKKCIVNIPAHTQYVLMTKFSPDDCNVASGSSDKTCTILDLETRKAKRIFKEHSHAVNDLTYNSDGTLVITASSDETIKLWDIRHNKSAATLHGHAREVAHLALAPDSQTLVSADSWATVKTWCMRTHALLDTFVHRTRGSIMFNSKGDRLIAGSALWKKKADAKPQQLPAQEQALHDRILKILHAPHKTLQQELDLCLIKIEHADLYEKALEQYKSFMES